MTNMVQQMMYPNRRSFLGGIAAIAGLAATAHGFAHVERGGGRPFSRQTVLDEARELAGRPYEPPAPVDSRLTGLDYDSYRQIRYRKDKAIWGGSPTRFSVELFAPGFLFESGVDLFIVENGLSLPVDVGPDSFDVPDPALGALLADGGKFAGFRLHYPVNRSDYSDEFVVFQGASYFRAVSAGQSYGLSARGLAVDVAEPTGEEFPVFRRFWIERPSARSGNIVVHALLDSEGVTGAYRFGIYPGAPTVIDVEATLFARRELTHIGFGGLTSMFMFGPVDGPDQPDYRPAVHDSQGLCMLTGRGEWLWRPLANPAALQVSAFVDENPKGFGLVQRARGFNRYQDLEAYYHRRPSCWIAPVGDWGPGHVQLVEIPSASEINDNIVAYWRPAVPLKPGQETRFAYRQTWPDSIVPDTPRLGHVIRSAYGLSLEGGFPQMTIDYDFHGWQPSDTMDAEVSVSAGRLVNTVLQPNPVTGGVRMFLTFDPQDADVVEIRALPMRGGTPLGETWLYRWLRA